MNNQVVYLVKFDSGYYAQKQPHYEWSYTDDPAQACQYKTLAKATERGEWGVGLVTGRQSNFTIEKFVVKTVMERVND